MKFKTKIIGIAISQILSFLFVSPLAAESPEGSYALRGVMEVASLLRLNKDGTYQYKYIVGSANYYSEGKWEKHGHGIIINSDDSLPDPEFILEKSEGKPGKEVRISILKKNRGVYGVAVSLLYEDDIKEMGYTQKKGLTFAVPEGPAPIALGLRFMGYDMETQWITMNPTQYASFTFQFKPGNLGRMSFKNLLLERKGEMLIMHLKGNRMEYHKLKPAKK